MVGVRKRFPATSGRGLRWTTKRGAPHIHTYTHTYIYLYKMIDSRSDNPPTSPSKPASNTQDNRKRRSFFFFFFFNFSGGLFFRILPACFLWSTKRNEWVCHFRLTFFSSFLFLTLCMVTWARNRSVVGTENTFQEETERKKKEKWTSRHQAENYSNSYVFAFPPFFFSCLGLDAGIFRAIAELVVAVLRETEDHCSSYYDGFTLLLPRNSSAPTI